MSHCYHFKELTFKYGIFDKSIDATYVLTMQNKGRFNNIHKQLSAVKPSKKIYVVFNEGYKACSKPLQKKNSSVDLIHANFEVFKHAQQHNYKSIMILEDDFIFDKEITYLKHVSKINEFCHQHREKSYCLSLGSLPLIVFPINDSFYYSFASTGTHCMIYSTQFMKETLSKNHNRIKDWDIYTNASWKRYVYGQPLCTQIFSETENQKNWPSFLGLKNFFLYIVKQVELDKRPQPGFNWFYFYAKFFSFVLFLLILGILIILLYLIYKLIYYICDKKKKK